MPAIVKVQVVAARDLPVMDRSSDSTDCFVEIRLAQTIHRTEVCKKNLNPEWNSQWFTYNVDDVELQDEPLTFKVMDYDQYSAHDAIGRVYISLDSAVFNESNSYSSLVGWFPIYDTLHGIRGEVHIKVKVEIIKDLYRHSSSEIMLFSGLVVPDGFSLEGIQGFLEELVVNDDPEYQWIDRIRPPRASNESRQQVFLKLSGELQRKIGTKALEAGGNAIIGYSQSFDLEGESGIVVRGIGTSVTLKPLSIQPLTHSTSYQQATDRSVELGEASTGSSVVPIGTTTPNVSLIQERPDPAKFLIPRLRHLSSSESDGGLPSSPVKPGGELGVQLLGASSGNGGGVVKSSEFNFYTLKSFPSGFVKTVAGIVAAHSVKLLDDINNPDEPETRDAWWLEIRQEIRSHSHSMNCDSVIGYSETTSICDGLCIFSATGTAVVTSHGLAISNSESVLESPEGLKNIDTSLVHTSSVDQVLSPTGDNSMLGADTNDSILLADESPLCGPCHISYSNSKSPYPVSLTSCSVCKTKLVPSILLSTADIPPDLLVRGEGCLIQARVCRLKKRLKNEDNASSVSSDLPFLEYSLHGRLLNKLKLKGMNALFGLDIVTTVGDTMIVGVATGTGVYLEALPSPGKIVFPVQESSSTRVDGFQDIQYNLDKQQERSRKRYKLFHKPKITVDAKDNTSEGRISPQPSSPNPDDPNMYGKDTKAFEIGEQKLKHEDMDDLMNDTSFHEEFHISNLSSVPGISEKAITNPSKVISFVSKQIFDSRGSLDQQLTSLMNKTLQKLLFRVRAMAPCIITNISFQVDLPDDDEVQVTLVAITARMLNETVNPSPLHQNTKFQATHLPQELVFPLGTGRSLEEPLQKYHGDTESHTSHQNSISVEDSKEGSLFQMFIMSPRPHLHKFSSSKYLSTINLFLIRETTSIKELGGMSSFLHTFISEAHALARAHVLSLGGNALVNYQLRQCVVMENHHKNQGQCLLNLAGDAAQIQREQELCD